MTGPHRRWDTPAPVAADIADDARLALGRVRVAWPHLGDDRHPATTRPRIVDRPIPAGARARLADQREADRLAAVEAYRHGRVIGGAHPAPGNLAPIVVRGVVARELVQLAERMVARATGRPGWLDVDGAGADRPVDGTVWCMWCHGTGEAQPPYGWRWDWPRAQLVPPAAGIGPPNYIPPVPCGRCDGAGRIQRAGTCTACGRTAGTCRHDRADQQTAAAVAAVAGLLDTAGVEAASDAEWVLTGLAEQVEQCLGLDGPTRIRLRDAECPVCGGRELHAETASPNPREWAVRCTNPDCVCAGPGRDGYPPCLCGIATPRRAGRPHRWPAAVWHGPKGLAAQLGIDLPDPIEGTRPAPCPPPMN